MPTYALKDVDPYAITICKRGANRQRIFLRKSVPEPTVSLPDAMPLRKQDGDWSAFYCVVAEPGAEEDPGLIGEDGTTDVWRDADEIRAAAHRLLKNGAYVNANHDEDAAPDCHIVESAIALTDMEVVDPSGVQQLIRKGSWYVAIEPNDEMRASIESGDLTGVSLEGSGIRVPLEKAADKDSAATHRTCQSCGAKMARDAGKCPSCGATYVRKTGLAGVVDRLFGRTPVRKTATFGERISTMELQDKSWRAFDTLQTVIYEAVRDDDEPDPQAVIRESVDQFRDYLLAAIGSGERAALAKELSTVTNQDNQEGDEVDAAEVKSIVGDETAALKKSNEDVLAAVTALAEKVDGLANAKPPEAGEEVTLEKAVQQLGTVADAVDQIDSQLSTLAKSIEDLSAASTQGDDTAVRKSTNSNPLAGLLG